MFKKLLLSIGVLLGSFSAQCMFTEIDIINNTGHSFYLSSIGLRQGKVVKEFYDNQEEVLEGGAAPLILEKAKLILEVEKEAFIPLEERYLSPSDQKIYYPFIGGGQSYQEKFSYLERIEWLPGNRVRKEPLNFLKLTASYDLSRDIFIGFTFIKDKSYVSRAPYVDVEQIPFLSSIFVIGDKNDNFCLASHTFPHFSSFLLGGEEKEKSLKSVVTLSSILLEEHKSLYLTAHLSSWDWVENLQERIDRCFSLKTWALPVALQENTEKKSSC